MSLSRRRPLLVAALGAALALVTTSACSGGSSDVVGAAGGSTHAAAADGSGGTINLYAYAVPKPGFDKLIPAFTATPAGKGVTFQQSYGASGDQSRKVVAGATADVVNFSVEPDVTRLVDAGLVDPSWNSGPQKGIPFGSVVTIVVRKGNPKGIKDWDDLLKPGVNVVTPNPFSSGSAKWNLLAPYTAKSDGGKNAQSGLDYVSALVKDHVTTQPKSGREASDTFLQGTGDALITAFSDFIYTPAAQTLLAQAGFRPVDEAVAKEYASSFPTPAKLWTIADLGGWKTVDKALFTKDTGTIAAIYDAATK
jgi:ABC-type sulfate transport system substrate-binding protein